MVNVISVGRNGQLDYVLEYYVQSDMGHYKFYEVFTADTLPELSRNCGLVRVSSPSGKDESQNAPRDIGAIRCTLHCFIRMIGCQIRAPWSRNMNHADSGLMTLPYKVALDLVQPFSLRGAIDS